MPEIDDKTVEQAYTTLVDALYTIKNREDCTYCCDPEASRPKPCPCPKCIATRALEETHSWRFKGARHYRVKTDIRERKLFEAWSRFATDHFLSGILDQEGVLPTPRDWFVASTIIQWLGSNVGISILTESGFKYTKFAEDADQRERERLL